VRKRDIHVLSIRLVVFRRLPLFPLLCSLRYAYRRLCYHGLVYLLCSLKRTAVQAHAAMLFRLLLLLPTLHYLAPVTYLDNGCS
jgi:hypothetical protein